jgi:hypothetical protein
MCRLNELASMFCASMAHWPPPLPAIFGHELPGYLGYLLFGAKLGYVAAAIPATGAAP